MAAVKGAVQIWLRLENLAVFFLSLVLYAWLGHPWTLFIILFLAPDISFLGYLAGSRVGSHTYNIVHNYAAPIAVGVAGVFNESSLPVAIGLIWTAHIGLDRALGYGLKYPTAFGHTHLGNLGKVATPSVPFQTGSTP